MCLFLLELKNVVMVGVMPVLVALYHDLGLSLRPQYSISITDSTLHWTNVSVCTALVLASPIGWVGRAGHWHLAILSSSPAGKWWRQFEELTMQEQVPEGGGNG